MTSILRYNIAQDAGGIFTWNFGNRISNEERPIMMVDVGANVGFESVYLASRYPNAIVYSIEICNTAVFYAMWNILSNGVDKRVHLKHAALTKSGVLSKLH
eukprot:gnl/MRDRNA2_/MRDRNA2_382127_c0_seq1.p1 gnl/MRDRNA2_/MRDRNA2_382127_c0~~gnl/MRDRNA2_/MRDRNA2_382127_c0_seq1.p1  ORF type:complete len:109 (-),score=18.80 gnl/MRDRNA2_/MRDRNA2_382127_c0_seq1:27-329(-)